jgi:hypothetical protein
MTNKMTNKIMIPDDIADTPTDLAEVLTAYGKLKINYNQLLAELRLGGYDKRSM